MVLVPSSCQDCGHCPALCASGGWLQTQPLLFIAGQLCDLEHCPLHEFLRWKAWQNSTPFGFFVAQFDGQAVLALLNLPSPFPLPFLPFPLPFPFDFPVKLPLKACLYGLKGGLPKEGLC